MLLQRGAGRLDSATKSKQHTYASVQSRADSPDDARLVNLCPPSNASLVVRHDTMIKTPCGDREFWPAVRGSWAISALFCPIQFVTFRYLPLEFRVLSVNVCDIAWTSVLSYFSHKAAPREAEAEGARVADGADTRALGAAERTEKGSASTGRRGGVALQKYSVGGGSGRGSNPALGMATP